MTTTSANSENSTSSSATARRTLDLTGLGSTSGQRGAEIVAGLRAIAEPSPETQALSTKVGRAAGRMVLAMEAPEVRYFVPARTSAVTHSILLSLPRGQPATFAEIACGFSPRGFRLARERPELRIIEIDLPDVVAEKKRRLSSLVLPHNLSWRAADLGVRGLDYVLEHQQVDVVCAESLMIYFTLDHGKEIAQKILRSLKPGGAFIYTIGFAPGINEALQSGTLGGRLFRRQAGKFVGVVDNEEQPRHQLKEAGYADVTTERILIGPDRYPVSRTRLYTELLVVARKGA